MSKTVIAVRGLGKRYRLGVIDRHTLQDELDYWWQRLRRRDPHQRVDTVGRVAPRFGHFWALRDVSFDVRRGEVIGVIGANGAGKSTLLKILSRITTPTEGEAVLKGRVRALLEVGTGFHPDLTGRENVFLNGAIMGMKAAEIESRMESILDFAEIGPFVDTPVKRYSSGMYVRLAFAVAAHLEPEIFIIDEVLSVGDVNFQEKCLGKIGEIVHGGRTVLFVSHNMGAVRKLCERTLWLDSGRMVQFGDTSDVVNAYLTGQAGREGEFRPASDRDSWQNDHMILKRVSLRNAEGDLVSSFSSDGRGYLEIEYRVVQSTARTRVGWRLMAQDSTVVFTSVDTDPDGRGNSREPGRYVSRCELPLSLLNGGRYQVAVFAERRFGYEPLFEFMNVLSFTLHVVSGIGSMGGESRQGVVRVDCLWEVSEVA